MFDACARDSFHFANTSVLVIDPHVYDSCHVHGVGSEKTEAAVDRICALVPVFRQAGMPVGFIWSSLDVDGISTQDLQKLGPESLPSEPLTTDIETSFGGIHPRVRAIMQPSDRVHRKFTNNAVQFSPDIVDGLVATGRRHVLLCGFNFSVCVTFTGIGLLKDTRLDAGSVTILSDASADNRVVTVLEQRDDGCMGESMNSLVRRHSGVKVERSDIVMARLGIS